MGDLADELQRFRSDGYVILPELLDAAERAALVAQLAPFEDGRLGRNDFEGERTKRVYSLAGKGEVFQNLAEHPRIVALLDELLLPNWLLSTMQSIRLHPGETPQAWHTDDAFYLIPRPRGLLAVSTIWAIEPFDDENGGTEVIPGSHLWSTQHPDERPHEVRRVVMPAGSVVVFDAALWHRGGENRSSRTRLALSPQYCQPWLRPQESQLLVVPPEKARTASPRMRAMLGYSIHPPFIGQVDGMNPLRLVDADYHSARGSEEARTADRFLRRPTS
jgi:ectoine hydroxylase-related dioxygenase (phytanoyl-CoA dioxygenase family)